MPSKLTLLLLSLAVSATSCRRFPSPPVDRPDPEEPCNASVNTVSGSAAQPGAEFAYIKPQFNRQNANQIVYLRSDANLPGRLSLFVYDLGNNKFWPLLHNHPKLDAMDFSCGQLGWILIQSTKFELWKMRADGTGLTQLTHVKSDGYVSAPSWSGDGSLMSYTVKRQIADVDGITIIAEANAQAVDTVYSATGSMMFTDNPAIMYSIDRRGVLTRFNRITNENIVYRSTASDSTARVCMLPDGDRLLACENDYIYRVNVLKMVTEKLRKVCPANHFVQPNLSADGKKIVAVRQVYEPLGGGLAVTSQLYVLDSECWHARKVLLP